MKTQALEGEISELESSQRPWVASRKKIGPAGEQIELVPLQHEIKGSKIKITDSRASF
jgi:hypothetical protein